MCTGIRKAVLTDLQSILNLNLLLFEFEKHFGDTFNSDWPQSEIGKEYFKDRLTGNSGIVLVAEFEGEVVGYICCNIDTYSYRLVNPICEIENMFVKDEFRNKGVGKSLVMELIKTAKEKGANRLRVGVLSNNIEAISFYKKLGLMEFELYLESPLA